MIKLIGPLYMLHFTNHYLQLETLDFHTTLIHSSWSQVKSVSLGVEPHLGLMTRYLLQFDGYGLVIVGRPF
jgi:hypothetical protein